ncbi:hypothetical protein [Vibrio scophthalmi]|uniref:Uncharacterized protein n=1 Tax=Vibrio scophthalmi LMG 19158 TaxID=870967 RepID=F9RLT2_9VIBR|nr:hypothetical protein [Vibrio scophthalmi]EGU38768.1 hypothetical protein VIS19158_02134 [Vibrio scophthalmi LMG 19158]
MQLNCSITHTLNQSPTNAELEKLANMIEQKWFTPSQQPIIAAFISRNAIKNFLEGCDS